MNPSKGKKRNWLFIKNCFYCGVELIRGVNVAKAICTLCDKQRWLVMYARYQAAKHNKPWTSFYMPGKIYRFDKDKNVVDNKYVLEENMPGHCRVCGIIEKYCDGHNRV